MEKKREFTQSHKSAISRGKTGKPHSPEHKAALSEAMGGRPFICVRVGDTLSSATEAEASPLIGQIFYSLNDAALQSGIARESISRVLRGVRASAGGFKFFYIEVPVKSDT